MRIAPYGTWESPITAELAAAAGGGPAWVQLAGEHVWWAEARPRESGRVAVLRGAPGQEPFEVLAAPWSARNRVHEYGGRPFTVVDGALVFTNWADQRLYRVDGLGEPTPLTPEPQRRHGLRYAEPVVAAGGAEVWCVRETITGDAPSDVRRELVAVPLDGGLDVRVLGASHHFMAGLRPSPDGARACWIGWDHPAMPWDGTELCVADVLDDGTLGKHRVVAGGPAEAVCQADWDGPDALLLVTDPDGWWNPHRLSLLDSGPARNLAPVAEELGGALWRPGQRWVAPLGGGRLAVLRAGRLAVLDSDGGLTDVATEWDYWTAPLDSSGGLVAGVAAGPRREPTVVLVDLSGADPGAGFGTELGADPGVGPGTGPGVVELSRPAAILPDEALLPRPVELRFAAPDGTAVPAYVYPPTNPGFEAPEGERPPYLVHAHGGPTGRNAPVLDLEIAFFTSRGFGVIAPNYGGSTGYGRAYRERLRDRWGIVDVQDCAATALALAAQGAADPDRLIVRGGSAGGWTTVQSMIAGPTYRCGTAMFPVLDLTRWATESHDFEAHYLHSLIGPLPDQQERYAQRSPLNHVDRLRTPILLMQGLDDQICPPAHTNALAGALAGSGVPHAYLTFDGEQHGFRRAETIVAALHAELSFYAQVLGLPPVPGVPMLELSS
jgi:dipeptidyl aminopeptidase/acylaminoacyl peptidase